MAENNALITWGNLQYYHNKLEDLLNNSSEATNVLNTAIGNAITVIDAVNAPLIEIEFYGKSVQDGTPTPENPVDIVSVGDDGAVSITACGKNLLDLSSAKTMGGAVPELSVNSFRTNAKDDGSRIIICPCNLLAGKTYYLSYGYEVENTTSSVVAYAKGGGGEQYGIGNRSFVALYNSTEIGFYIPNTVVGENVYFTVTNPQIEEGTARTDFVPFQGCKTAEITSGLPLCSVGDVCDELVFNADDVGKVIKRTAKLDSYSGEGITGDYISSTGGLDMGAEVVYVLDEPVEIQLNDEEMTVLATLQTYSGMTEIFNDEDATIYFKYWCDDTFYTLLNDMQTQLDTHTHNYIPLTGGIMTGALTAQSNTDYTTPQIRNVTMSTSAASGGSNGQIHYTYE